MISIREWRRLRDQAGILIYYKVEAVKRNPKLRKTAEEIYEQWRTGKISFKQALKELKKLAA